MYARRRNIGLRDGVLASAKHAQICTADEDADDCRQKKIEERLRRSVSSWFLRGRAHLAI